MLWKREIVKNDKSMIMPAPYCDYWTLGSLICYVLGNLAIAASYYGIPFVLMWVAHRLPDGQFPAVEGLLHSKPMLWLFSLFIFFCGTGHLIDVWAVWFPNAWLRGIWECGTASVSVATCFTLFRLKSRAATSVA